MLQGGNCWCSDYAPANQVTTYDCNEQCPGYPYDWCGSQSAGLFGYYQLSVAPSGTAGGATPASSSSVSFTSSTSGPPFHSFSFASAPSSASVSSSVVVATPVYSTDSSTSATTVRFTIFLLIKSGGAVVLSNLYIHANHDHRLLTLPRLPLYGPLQPLHTAPLAPLINQPKCTPVS